MGRPQIQRYATKNTTGQNVTHRNQSPASKTVLFVPSILHPYTGIPLTVWSSRHVFAPYLLRRLTCELPHQDRSGRVRCTLWTRQLGRGVPLSAGAWTCGACNCSLQRDSFPASCLVFSLCWWFHHFPLFLCLYGFYFEKYRMFYLVWSRLTSCLDQSALCGLTRVQSRASKNRLAAYLQRCLAWCCFWDASDTCCTRSWWTS